MPQQRHAATSRAGCAPGQRGLFYTIPDDALRWAMLDAPRLWISPFCLGLLAALCGCEPAPAPPAPVLSSPVAEHFSLQTPIDQIAADPRGKAVLERDLPGMMASPHYQMFNSMSLSDLAPLSGGRLIPEKLKKVQDDLLALPPKAVPPSP